MMDVLKDLLSYLINKEARLTAKASLILLTIVALWVVNNIFGFTYYYNTRNRIEQVKSLNELVLNDSISPEVRQRAQILQLQILTRKNAPEKAINYAGKVYAQIKYALAHRPERQPHESVPIDRRPKQDVSPPRNEFWFLLSSCGIWFSMAVILVPFIINEGFTKGWAVALAALLIAEAMFYGFGALYYYGIGLIPIIGKNWGWNYAIGILAQLATVSIPLLVSRVKTHRRK